MKNHFPEDYCPQREKVLDLTRSVLSGGRRYARHRRNFGRYCAKVERRKSRERLARITTWICDCGGDVEADCLRCLSDALPTKSEINGGWGLPNNMVGRHSGHADDLGQLFTWYHARTEGLNHFEMEMFLRTTLLSPLHGHSLKTRHAYDHLFEEIRNYRRNNHCGKDGYHAARDLSGNLKHQDEA